MLIGTIRIPLERWQIDEILDKRIAEQRMSIEDLFMVWCSAAAVPDPGFYDTQVETKYGNLKFFFVPECPRGKSFVLHRRKFDYPKKGNADHFTKDGDLVR
jgi:hypothetical protein